MHEDVKRRHVGHAAENGDVAAGQIRVYHGATCQGYGKLPGDHRLSDFGSRGDVDGIHEQPVLFEVARFFREIERRLCRAHRAISDRNALGLGARSAG